MKEKDLINKSHIIPDFMYKYLFDEKHKFILSSSEDLKKGLLKNKLRFTGDYEGGLLCSTCDRQVIGQYETYASKVIYAESIPQKMAPIVKHYFNDQGEEWSECSNIDYKRFKLFLLSILWRASISSREIFKEVKIGKHEEIIRKMIWKGDPRKESDYPIIFMTTVHDKTIPNDYVLQPRTIKLEGHHMVTFPITGMIYFFFVSSHAKPVKILKKSIKENNSIIIEHIPEGRGWEYMLKYLGVER